MSIYQYTPPVGFGNDVPKKKNPYEDELPAGAAGAGTVNNTPLPGLGNVASYMPQTSGQMDFGQTTQLQLGSRDIPLEMDAPYTQLLAKLGHDEATAKQNMIDQQNRLITNLGITQRDLGTQSMEDKYGIDASLRSRGVGRSSQQFALQARADANLAKQQSNAALQEQDQYNAAGQNYLSTTGNLEDQRLQGLSDASSRLQSRKDAEQARIDQASWNERQMAATAQQNQQLIDAMNRQSTNPTAAVQAPSQPSQPAAAGGQSFADWYASLSPTDRAAWDAFSRGPAAPAQPIASGGGGGYSGGGGGGNPAAPPANYRPNPPPPLALTPKPTPPKQLTPARGYY